jgi:hypothetical protein
MKRIRTLIFAVCLISAAMLMIACGATEEDPTATAAPEIAPEPAEGSKTASNFQVPTTKSEVPRISAEELKQRLDAGEEIIVADTRSESTYGYGHVAGAILVPDFEVEAHLDKLPKDKDIVFYCS